MIVPNDGTWNLFNMYLCENVMKNNNTLFVYLNSEKDDSIGGIPGLNVLYKMLTSELIIDSYSSLA